MYETSNPVLNLLATRRSAALKTLAAPAPSEDELLLMLKLAARVPDHAKLVPWRFIVIAGDARRKIGEVIGRCYAADHPEADGTVATEMHGRLAIAPVVIGVVSSPKSHPKVPEWEQVLSAGAACMNLLIAAKAMGYGAVWLSEWYAYDRRVLAELGLAEQEKLAGFIHIGTEPSPREDRERPVMERIVSRYGG